MFTFTSWCERKLLYLICHHYKCVTIIRVWPTVLHAFWRPLIWYSGPDSWVTPSWFLRVLNKFQIAADKTIVNSLFVFFLPSGVLDSLVKSSFRGSTVAAIFPLYKNGLFKANSNRRCKDACTCLVHCLALRIAVASPCPSSLFRILGPVLGKWGSWPWLSASPSSHIASSWLRGRGWHSDGKHSQQTV